MTFLSSIKIVLQLINRLSYNLRPYQRYLFVFAAMVFVLLSPCHVKNGIKRLAGIPANTEQGLSKKGNHFFVNNGTEKCVNETSETKISLKVSSNINDLLPAALRSADFGLLLYHGLPKEQPHPLYRTSKIPGALPIFLQHRKLII